MNTQAKSVAPMLCPPCQIPLQMSERQGIEIDYCPQCRGVWLDRGELDKILERSVADDPSKHDARRRERERDDDYDDRDNRDRHHDRKHGYAHGGYRRKSWLKELFD